MAGVRWATALAFAAVFVSTVAAAGLPGNAQFPPTPTATPLPALHDLGTAAGAVAIGDCDGSGKVEINDLIFAVNIALGSKLLSECPTLDTDDNGVVEINDLIFVVGQALGLATPTPTPSPLATGAATATASRTTTPSTPTRTATGTATTLATSSATATDTAAPTVTATATAEPRNVAVLGVCKRPGNGPRGRVPCSDDTVIDAAYVCPNQGTCVDANRSAPLPSTTVQGGQGEWTLLLSETEAAADLIFAAQIPGGQVFRHIGLGKAPVGFAHTSGTAPTIITIGPDSEGVTRVVVGEGLENFSAESVDLLESRAESELDYTGQSDAVAASNAEAFVRRLLNLEVRILLSDDGRFAYYAVLNESAFRHRITTVAIDGGRPSGVVQDCGTGVAQGEGVLIGEVVFGNDVLEPSGVKTTPLQPGVRVAFDGTGQGRVCPDCDDDEKCRTGECALAFSFREGGGMQPIAPSASAPGIPAAQRVVVPPSQMCVGGRTYGFGTAAPTTTVLRGSPPPESDGFVLNSGSMLVFASETTPSPLFSFGVAGFRLDVDGGALKAVAEKDTAAGTRKTLSFAPATETVLPILPQAIAASDIIGDPGTDVAVADGGAGGVVLFEQDSNGSLVLARTLSGSHPFAEGLAIVDVDGGGLVDLVTAHTGGAVVVWRQTTPGTFEATDPALSIPAFPTALAVGDVDGADGPDIVTVHDPGMLEILLNDGAGNFTALPPGAIGSYPAAVAVANLAGDGAAEVITADEGTAMVSVFQIVGSGVVPIGSYPAVRYPVAIVAAELDGQAPPDVAVVSGTDHMVAVLLSAEDGTLGDAIEYPVIPDCFGTQVCPPGLFPAALTSGDVDGDGHIDLIAANESGDLTILLNRGDGLFDPARSKVAGPFPSGVAIGDFNRDGRTDLINISAAARTTTLLSRLSSTATTARARRPKVAGGLHGRFQD